MATIEDLIAETVKDIPEEDRECAAEFMRWFDATIASQRMMKVDPEWRKVEHHMYSGWYAAWKKLRKEVRKNESPNQDTTGVQQDAVRQG